MARAAGFSLFIQTIGAYLEENASYIAIVVSPVFRLAHLTSRRASYLFF